MQNQVRVISRKPYRVVRRHAQPRFGKVQQPAFIEALTILALKEGFSYGANAMQQAASEAAKQKDVWGVVAASAFGGFFAYLSHELQQPAWHRRAD